MKHFFTIASFLCLFSAVQAQKPAAATQGRSIHIRLTPLKNMKVYLGSYYGTTLALFDSAQLNDKSEGVFQSNNKLTGGIYFIVSKAPEYAIQFDLLMDDEQHFSISADT